MWFMLVGIAAISFFLTIIPLLFYKFNEKEQQEAVAEIKRRKEAALGEANGTDVETEFAEFTEEIVENETDEGNE